MALDVQEKAQIVADYQQAVGDTGSPEVQVALLTPRCPPTDPRIRGDGSTTHTDILVHGPTRPSAGVGRRAG
jgi:small subunit ribosomal protein S15